MNLLKLCIIKSFGSNELLFVIRYSITETKVLVQELLNRNRRKKIYNRFKMVILTHKNKQCYAVEMLNQLIPLQFAVNLYIKFYCSLTGNIKNFFSAKTSAAENDKLRILTGVKMGGIYYLFKASQFICSNPIQYSVLICKNKISSLKQNIISNVT